MGSIGSVLVLSALLVLLFALTIIGHLNVSAQTTATAFTERVSVSGSGVQGNSESSTPAISADGRYVAFASFASNLVSGDTNGKEDIFVFDRQARTIARISKSSSSGQANDDSYTPAISADGRYIAFSSDATNLVSGDTNSFADIFVHDRQTGTTTRVSHSSANVQANARSLSPSISGDGRYVAFSSGSSTLVAGDTNDKGDIFVHDRQTNSTFRVSVASNGAQSNSHSSNPVISADGHVVVFESDATNLVAEDTSVWDHAFAHDLLTGETTIVSVASSGAVGNHNTYRPSISGDGRYATFHSVASNLVGGDTNGRNDIFVHDRQTGITSRISMAADGSQGNGECATASISANGRFVVYQSGANNLVVGDTNNQYDAFLYDRQLDETVLISVSTGGTQANRYSGYESVISANGQHVGFQSLATNLVSGDTNNSGDIFVRDQGDAFSSYQVGGFVRDSNGNGLAGISVTAGAGQVVQTNDDGSFLFENLQAGLYSFAPSQDSFFFTPPVLGINLTGDTELNFTRYPCEAPSGLNVCDLLPGDILLTRSPTYTTEFSIGGTYFTHAALYLGEVAEPNEGEESVMPRLAEGQGYRDVIQDEIWETPILNRSIWTGDNLLDWAVVRPNLSESVKNSAIQYIRAKAADATVTFDISTPKHTVDKFYCSKLVWRSYLDVDDGKNLEVNMGLGSFLLDFWVTPDDLFYSTLEGSRIIDSGLGLNANRIILMLWSPAHITLIDPSGLRTGYDPSSGGMVNEIPLATYTVPPDAEVETITAVGVGAGWQVLVTGYDSGEYKLDYSYLNANAQNIVITSTTAVGQTDLYNIDDPTFIVYLPLFVNK